MPGMGAVMRGAKSQPLIYNSGLGHIWLPTWLGPARELKPAGEKGPRETTFHRQIRSS